MTKQGYSVVSCDPLYQFTTAQIQARIDFTYETVMAQTLANRELFVWKDIASPEELGDLRREAMNEFLADYDSGGQGRYVAATLPQVPFVSSTCVCARGCHFR